MSIADVGKSPVPFRWSNLSAMAAGGLSAMLGLAVMLGWHTHNETLLQIHPTLVAMVYNTALCFALCGAGLLALAFSRPPLALTSGAVAMGFGLFNLIQQTFGVDLGIDELLMEAWQKTANPHPGRMAPQTSLCFVLTGAALALRSGPALLARRSLLVGVAGSIVVALGSISLFGRLFDIDTSGWRGFLAMAPHTAVGFAVLGVGLMALAWSDGRDEETGAPRWLPVPVGVGALAAALCLWQAMIAQEQTQVERIERALASEGTRMQDAQKAQLLAEARSSLPQLVLAVGLLVASLLAATVYLAQTARLRLETIRGAVGKLSATSAGLLANASQRTAGAQQQAAAVAETLTSVAEVTQTATQAAQRVKEVGAQATAAAAVGKDGRQAVEDSIVAMKTVQTQMKAIAETILTLVEQAQTIGEIIATVNYLAEQTNLLALNAAIEASRAGQHGRGFAVVASEVKELAGQSKTATAQVRQILARIQEATNAAVLSTEQGTNAVARASRVTARAGETIATLAGTLAQTAQTAAQIVASAVQQATGMAQVNEAMKNIERVTRENEAAVQEVEQAAENLNALSTHLAGLASA